MKLLNYLTIAFATLFAVSCSLPEDDNSEYPILQSIDNTLWWSYDKNTITYYDVWYDGDGKGRMLGYDTSERENETVNRPFTYTFTPATDLLDGIVRINFEDGVYYGGILIPKGEFYINNTPVYFIQLYEVDDDGNVLYDMDGNLKSTLQMWKE